MASTALRGYRVFAFQSAQQLLQVVRPPEVLVAVNAEKVARGDERLRAIVNRHVGYADGMGVVLGMRQRGLECPRISGADLCIDLLRTIARTEGTYLVGSRPDVIAAAARALEKTIPGLNISGYRDGYLDARAVADLKDDLAATRPAVVLVGMGSPRQELLIEELMTAWPALYMGVGGTFDVLAGRSRRAPPWMQRHGLEWAFRFVDDPRRLPRLGSYLRFAWWLSRGQL